MRLLSFISEIERAVIAKSPFAVGGAWTSQRLVNFKQQLARVTLTANPATELAITGGAIFLQCFSLADGSLCLKASLSWDGSEAPTVMAVYDTPGVNWNREASRIASAFLEGPRELACPAMDRRTVAAQAPLVAVAS